MLQWSVRRAAKRVLPVTPHDDAEPQTGINPHRDHRPVSRSGQSATSSSITASQWPPWCEVGDRAGMAVSIAGSPPSGVGSLHAARGLGNEGSEVDCHEGRLSETMSLRDSTVRS